MKYLNLIPACHGFLKENPDRLQILLSLSVQGCRERYPDVVINQEQLLTFFRSTGIISGDAALPQADEAITADCFSVVSEYKCSYVCQICPLSARYKNAKESEESALLSYAMASPENFLLLRENGIESKSFQALFLVNPIPSGSLVATLPLNRLAYFYLECTAGTLASFKSLPADIAAAIARDNQKKLTQSNIKAISMYLQQIQKGYHEKSKESIAAILRDSYQLSPNMAKISEGTGEQHPPEKIIKKPPASPKNEQQIPDRVTVTSDAPDTLETKRTNDTIPSEDTACLEGLLIQSSAITPPAAPTILKEPALIIKKAPGHADNTVQYKEPPMPAEKIIRFLPSCFSVYESGGFPIIQISMHKMTDREEFLLFMLNHPKLAVEVVTDPRTEGECLLFYGSGAFYLLSCNDEGVPDLLSLFLSKSPVRNQICLDPYRLCHYLATNNLPSHNVFSLRAAYTALAKAQKRNHLKTINEMILELASRTNLHALPAHIFCMQHYLKMYDVITRNTTFMQKEVQELFSSISSINALLGISYELQDSVVAPSGTALFDFNENMECNFHYDKEMKMKTGIYSVTYTFVHAHPGNNMAMDVLYHFARKELLSKFSYRLLAFRQDSFTIATHEKDYIHLCEIVANIATHIATRKGLLPVYVSEERIPS